MKKSHPFGPVNLIPWTLSRVSDRVGQTQRNSLRTTKKHNVLQPVLKLIIMKSYLIVWFNSEGSRPSEVNRRLMSLGFKPIQGSYDYVYEWDSNTELEEILNFGDRIQVTLKGLNVMFKIETVDGN